MHIFFVSFEQIEKLYFTIQIKYVNLINIVADEEIIPECLQDDCNLEKIMLQLEKLNGKSAEEQVLKAGKIMQLLGTGNALTPSQRAAQVVRKVIKQYK